MNMEIWKSTCSFLRPVDVIKLSIYNKDFKQIVYEMIASEVEKFIPFDVTGQCFVSGRSVLEIIYNEKWSGDKFHICIPRNDVPPFLKTITSNPSNKLVVGDAINGRMIVVINDKLCCIHMDYKTPEDAFRKSKIDIADLYFRKGKLFISNVFNVINKSTDVKFNYNNSISVINRWSEIYDHSSEEERKVFSTVDKTWPNPPRKIEELHFFRFGVEMEFEVLTEIIKLGIHFNDNRLENAKNHILFINSV